MLQPWPLGLQWIWALHLTVEQPRVFPRPSDFFSYDFPFSKYRHANWPIFRELCKSSPYFSCSYRVGGLVIYHIWELGRSNEGVAPTVTSDDLDLLFWPWHTFKEKFSKGRISETITNIATLLCTVTQLDMISQVTPKYDHDLCKISKNVFNYFSVFWFQYADDLT